MKTIPQIFDSWTSFRNSKYGTMLPDCISLLVEENRNGAFDLVLKYPLNGTNVSMLTTDAIISTVPSQGASAEPFRIYKIERDIQGLVTASAHHIVYDMDGCIIPPFTATTLTELINALNTHLNNDFSEFQVRQTGYTSPYSFDFTTLVPKTLWSILGDVCAKLKCELSYVYFSGTQREVIYLNKERGITSRAVVAYGYNLLSMQGAMDNEDVYTAIYPYYYRWIFGQPVEYLELPEKTLSTGASSPRTRILPVSMSNEFGDVPTVAQLRAAANQFIASTDWTVKNDVSFDFVPLQNTTEYEGIPDQVINLCDTVTVSADYIGVTLQAKVIRTVYNPLTDKYDAMTIGTKTDDVADTIVSMEKQIGDIEKQGRYSAYNGGVS